MLNFENLGEMFVKIIQTPHWAELQNKFNDCGDIYVLGHGGNLAVADHAASTRTTEQMNKSLVLGISSSGNSTDILKALQWADDNGMQVAIISSKDIKTQISNLTKVILGADYYHTAEVLTLLLTYELTHGSGKVCPPIGENDPEALNRLNWKGGEIRKHSYPDEQINIGVDFDGVIHKCSKGFYDGTIYDDPIPGAFEALEKLSEKYTIIMFSAKARADRGLVNGKTGIQLIWEWLEKYDMSQFVNKVTAEKPRARFYIDDKAIRFTDWESTFKKIEDLDG